jgi:hypothetical protein
MVPSILIYYSLLLNLLFQFSFASVFGSKGEGTKSNKNEIIKILNTYLLRLKSRLFFYDNFVVFEISFVILFFA